MRADVRIEKFPASPSARLMLTVDDQARAPPKRSCARPRPTRPNATVILTTPAPGHRTHRIAATVACVPLQSAEHIDANFFRSPASLCATKQNASNCNSCRTTSRREDPASHRVIPWKLTCVMPRLRSRRQRHYRRRAQCLRPCTAMAFMKHAIHRLISRYLGLYADVSSF